METVKEELQLERDELSGQLENEQYKGSLQIREEMEKDREMRDIIKDLQSTKDTTNNDLRNTVAHNTLLENENYKLKNQSDSLVALVSKERSDNMQRIH